MNIKSSKIFIDDLKKILSQFNKMVYSHRNVSQYVSDFMCSVNKLHSYLDLCDIFMFENNDIKNFIIKKINRINNKYLSFINNLCIQNNIYTYDSYLKKYLPYLDNDFNVQYDKYNKLSKYIQDKINHLLIKKIIIDEHHLMNIPNLKHMIVSRNNDHLSLSQNIDYYTNCFIQKKNNSDKIINTSSLFSNLGIDIGDHNDDSKKVAINLSNNNYYILMAFVTDNLIREKINIIYNEYYNSLLKDIANLVITFHDMARAMNYNNYFTFKKYTHNIKYDNIMNLIIQISSQINEKYYDEIKEFNSSVIHYHDLYYNLNNIKTQICIKHNDINKYFPLYKIIDRILKIYNIIFSINIVEENDCKMLKKNFKKYTIYTERDIHIGYLYIDFFNDDFDKPKSIIVQNDNNIDVIFLLIDNINKKKKINNYILLDIIDAMNIFKEIGASIYKCMNKKKISDHLKNIIEYIFEFLFWNKYILKYLSSHYLSGKQISNALYHKLLAAKNIDTAIHFKNMCFYSLYDIFIHSSEFFYESCKQNELKFDRLSVLFGGLYSKFFSKIFNTNNVNIVNYGNKILILDVNIYTKKYSAIYYKLLFEKIISLHIVYNIFNNKINNKIGKYLFSVFDNDNLDKYIYINNDIINIFNSDYKKNKSEQLGNLEDVDIYSVSTDNTTYFKELENC